MTGNIGAPEVNKSKDRIILHCDCNSFFASVESVMRPELKEVPMAVAGDPENRRGIILAKNELAKRYNVQTAEPIWQAKRKCPGLVCVKPNYHKYHEYYEKINQIYLDYTDLVEPFSIDESYLDVTGTLHLFKKTPKELADSIRARVKSELGITISVGVSFCKVFAKLGSDYKKPDATTVIMRKDIEHIVYPLPVSDLLFVGRRSAEILNARGIRTVADLAKLERPYLESILGKQGDILWSYVHGEENDPVHSFYDRHEVKSVSNGMTFKRDLIGEEEIKAGVSALSDSVASRLRYEHKKCTVVQISIKDPKFKTIQRQRKLLKPTHLQREITDVAMELILENWDINKPIRLITVGGSELVPENEEPMEQLSLFGDIAYSGKSKKSPKYDPGKQEKIEGTIDTIRNKYGSSSIRFGYTKNEELGIDIFGKGRR